MAGVREAHVLLNMLYHPRKFSKRKIIILVLIVLPEDGLDLIAGDIDPQLFDDILELGELDRVAVVGIDKPKDFEDAASLEHHQLLDFLQDFVQSCEAVFVLGSRLLRFLYFGH